MLVCECVCVCGGVFVSLQPLRCCLRSIVSLIKGQCSYTRGRTKLVPISRITVTNPRFIPNFYHILLEDNDAPQSHHEVGKA